MKGVSNNPHISQPARQSLSQEDSVSTRDLGGGVYETAVRSHGKIHVYKYDVYADRWLDEPAKPDFLWEGQCD